jgi:hypothetical protein
MCATIKVALIKGKDILSRVACQCFLICPTTGLFVFLPEIIGFWPGCVPIIEDLDIRIVNPQHVAEF